MLKRKRNNINRKREKFPWRTFFIVIIVIVSFIISWFFNFNVGRINLGALFTVVLILSHCINIIWMEHSAETDKMQSFRTWTSIYLEEKKERLERIEDKLSEIEDDDYNIKKDKEMSLFLWALSGLLEEDDEVPPSKKELIIKLTREEKALEDKIKEIGKAL